MFVTISFPDMYINTIFDALYKDVEGYSSCQRIIHRKELKVVSTVGDQLSDLETRMRILINNPVLSVELFELRLQNAVELIFLKKLGDSYYFVRLEIQKRGALHAHGLVNMRDGPNTISSYIILNYVLRNLEIFSLW